MSLFKKPIFTSISPTMERDDIFLVLKILCQPWQWQFGKNVETFRKQLIDYLGVSNLFLFDSGRQALYAILLSLNIKEGDEVLVQAFTCNAAVNPILWLKARPVYVDVALGSYNMSLQDLEKKITSKSKAVIVQHTFGMPAPMDEILKIAKKHNLKVIEDVAHALGVKYKGKKLGIWGDAAILSFGRSKIISTVSGGAAVVNDKSIAENLDAFYKSCKPPRKFWILRQLLHPLIFSSVTNLYNFFYLGRVIAVLAKSFRLYTPSVYGSEKRGGRPPLSPSRLPNALAVLGIKQLAKLESFTEHRIKLAKVYEEGFRKNKRITLVKNVSKGPLLYFPLVLENGFVALEVVKMTRQNDIYLDIWPAKIVVGPEGTHLNKLFYIAGTCPQAESLALESIVLPVSPVTTREDAKRIINLISNYVHG